MPIELRQQNMALFFHSADGGKSSAGSADMQKVVGTEPPTLAFSGESRYLAALWVFGNEEPSKSPSSGFKLGSDQKDQQDKIKSALKLLRFREHRVIIQFWLPVEYGKHKLLTTVDQPFGVGAIDDEGLQSYRKHSVDNPVVVVRDLEEGDHSPIARVFRHGLPEWTLDVTNYSSRDFPQRECAIRCNFRGYMALPVFDSTAGLLCVGVLELLTSSKYNSFAFEVHQVHNALKMEGLTSPQALDYPPLDVHNEHTQNELEKILRIQKEMCGIHELPFAQTWAVSPSSSFACHEQTLLKTCNSFDSRCLKKDCMSTAALPFHVPDLSKWAFRKACKEQHLEKSKGVAGRAMLSHGSCFCGDVTKLSKDEYPLVYKAHMSRLSCCFAIFLHSVETANDYVLEFFLPLEMKDGIGLQNLVHTLKTNIEIAYGFELGDVTRIQIVGPPSTDVSYLSLNTQLHTIQIPSNATSKSNILEMISSDSESMVTNAAKTESANLPNQGSLGQNDSSNYSDKITTTENLTVALFRGDVDVSAARQHDSTTSYPDVSIQKKSDIITDAGDKRNSLKQGRKRKIDSLTMEAVQKHLGNPIGDAAKSLNVSRSTLKRFCREHNIQSWPLPKHNKKAANVANLKLPQKSWSEQQLQPSTNVLSSIHVVVSLLVNVKRWSCSRKRHGFSGRWWRCGKHSYLPAKSDFIYRVARMKMHSRRWRNKISIRHALQKRDHPTVGDNTSKPKYTTDIINPYSRFDRQLPEPIIVYTSPKQNGANYIYLIARLKVQLRWWRNKISIRHASQKTEHTTVNESTSKPEYTTNIPIPYPEPILVHAFPKQNGADYIYRVANLMVRLRRWRNKISARHASQKRYNPAASERPSKPKYTTNLTNLHSHFDLQLPGSILVHASPEQNVSDIRMVTVKATYKDDMIKFQLPTSSGLSELENQVAQRINLKNRGFRLKYMDEDRDLILLACDADVHNLLRFSGSNGTLKLFVKMVDD